MFQWLLRETIVISDTHDFHNQLHELFSCAVIVVVCNVCVCYLLRLFLPCLHMRIVIQEHLIAIATVRRCY